MRFAGRWIVNLLLREKSLFFKYAVFVKTIEWYHIMEAYDNWVHTFSYKAFGMDDKCIPIERIKGKINVVLSL